MLLKDKGWACLLRTKVLSKITGERWHITQKHTSKGLAAVSIKSISVAVEIIEETSGCLLLLSRAVVPETVGSPLGKKGKETAKITGSNIDCRSGD